MVVTKARMMTVVLFVLPILLSVESKASGEECLQQDADTLLFNDISGCRKCTNRYYGYIEKNCIGKGYCTHDVDSLSAKKYGKCALRSERLDDSCGTNLMHQPDADEVTVTLSDGTQCTLTTSVRDAQFDSEWDDWEDWGVCSADCGDGKRNKTRTCTRGSDDEDCEAGEVELDSGEVVTDVTDFVEEDCNDGECPVDGTWNGWVEGECSVTCGSGTITSTRTCEEPTNGGQECSCSDLDDCTTKTEACTLSDCPVPVDGTWNDWVEGECSVTCGSGTITSTRTCEEPTDGGQECSCSDLDDCTTKTEACTLSDCPVDGTWNGWVEGECSVTCENGTKTSTRTCDGPFYGGQDCSCSDLSDCTTKTEVCTLSDCTRELRLYWSDHPDFEDTDSKDTVTTTTNMDYLGWTSTYSQLNGRDWNDKTDAAYAVEGAWALYNNAQYEYAITTLCPGEKKYEFNYMGDQVSSVQYLSEVPEECNSGKLLIYSKDYYEGRRAIITSNVSSLVNQPDELDKEDSFNDDINSVQAIKGYWILYRDANYGDWRSNGLCIKEGDEVAKIDDSYKDRVSSIQQVDSC